VEILLQKTADAETAPLPNHEQEES
jgi:hypothetical protein